MSVYSEASADRELAARNAVHMGALDRLQAEALRLRALVAAYHAAAESTDLERDVRAALDPLTRWDTEDGAAPDWLVDAVIGLLAPLKAERDRYAARLRELGVSDG